MKKRTTVFLLLFAILVSMLPIINTESEEAKAGTGDIKEFGNVVIKYESQNGYKIFLDANKNLIITSEYFTDSTATLSYHTSTLYFATRDSGMNPGSLSVDECFPVGVEKHDIVISGSSSYDTYTVSNSKLEDMITTLFGKDGLKTTQTVYLSEGFRLKKRDSVSDDTWDIYGKVYDSLEGIRGAEEWSDTTYANFVNYYDIEITLELVKHNITVEASEGGMVGQSHYEAYEGDNITINAYSNDDYDFTCWEVISGNIGRFDILSAESSFVMPASDVVIRANFEKKTRPPITKPPIVTPDLTKPTPTPTPAPPPTTPPTPTPSHIPEENSETIRISVRYYSTDAGYSIGGIYNGDITPKDDAFGYVGTKGQDNKGYRFNETIYENKGVYAYSIGTDERGNTWYFLPDGNKATYVHPKIYRGHSADSAEIRYISELTFPQTLTYNGSSYTVTSIGGGTDKYALNAEESGNRPISYGVCGPTYNEYDLFNQQVYTGGGLSVQTNAETKKRILGVIGNGQIVSSYLSLKSYDNGTYTQFQFENSYYVYNTTLQYITIPDTVTTIESYAFSGCQALVKIIGGDNVKTVGEYAFSAIGNPVLEKSVVKQNSSGSIRNFEYNYYNGSYSFDAPTATMSAWKNSVVLSDYMELPVFGSLEKLGVSSFEKRKNLFVVDLPAGLEEVGANAFAHCWLDKITVPGKTTAIGSLLIPSREESRINTTPEQTLGTKGKNVAVRTLIVTELNTKAMDYGMTYEDYYDVRAGYNVIYHNNSTPAETYITKPSIAKKNSLLKERFPLSNAYIIVDEERYYEKEVLLDTEGGLYLVSYNNLPVRQIPELTFNNLYVFYLKRGSETTDAYYGTVLSGSCTTVSCCLAFADNGTVFLFQSDKGEWIVLDIPTGSFNFAFHKNSFGQGGQSSSQTDEKLDLYYITDAGVLSQKNIYSMRISSSLGSDRNSSTYAYTLYNNGSVSVALPGGVSAIKRFCFSQESTSNPGYPPEIMIEDTLGGFWLSYFGNWSEQGFYRLYPIGEVDSSAEQKIYADYKITDFGPRLVGYNQTEKIYDLMFETFGKEFRGWTLHADGTGILYQPGQKLNITAPTTLFAKWDGDAKKRIQYIANGGVGTMKDDIYPINEPNPVILKKNTFMRRGYEFAGWSYKAEPGASDLFYDDEAQIVIAPGITKLYAQWKPIEYTIRVGTEDARVMEQTFSDYTMRLDDELVLGTKEDKVLTVTYDLNDRGTGNTLNAKATFVSKLTESNTEASLCFLGWRLYEDKDKDAKITSEDIYIGYYEASSVLKNLGSEHGAVFYVFPYWGGNASYVRLPEVIRDGYVFVGYTPGVAYDVDYFKTTEVFFAAIQDNRLIPVPVGSGARYQPKADGEVLYAYYEKEKTEGQIYGFEVYDVFGTPIWESLCADEKHYTIGEQDEDSGLWNTLPLRKGVHPYYRNLGGLPMGGGVSFQIMSTGSFAGEDVKLTIIPYLCRTDKEGYIEADFYFEQKKDCGIFLKKWSDEEQEMVLHADEDSKLSDDLTVRIWYGTFRLPDMLFCAEQDTDVLEYQQYYGLDFEESFWIKDTALMLRFGIRAENSEGEILYYGMLPEAAGNNMWLQEAGELYREDYDKNRYEILGGEVAVIYPGDSTDKWNSIHGIY